MLSAIGVPRFRADDNLTVGHIRAIERYCYENVGADELYTLRNDVKCRAVYTAKSYDEFK